MQYFFYGTLLDADVRRFVLGSEALIRGQTAWLDCFERVGLPGKYYPTLVPAAGTVCGGLFSGITARQRHRLIRFEGTEYRELSLPVTVASGEVVTGRIFLLRRSPNVISHWCFQRWQRLEKTRFLRALAAGTSACNRRRF